MHRKLIALTLLMAVLFSGCTGSSIREDTVAEDYPAVAPKAGMELDFNATLYYRLRNEGFLVTAAQYIRLQSGEHKAEAVIRTLSAGPPEGSHERVDGVLPEDVRATNVRDEGGVLYVTLNEAIFAIESWSDLNRQLAYYAMINSLCALDGVTRVQLLVERSDTLGEERASGALFALTSTQQFVEPAGANTSATLTREKCVLLVCGYIQNGVYERAYALMSDDPLGTKPDYLAFSNAMQAITVTDYRLHAITTETEGVRSEASMTVAWEDHLSQAFTSNVVIQVMEFGGLYLVGCRSFMAAFGVNS